jgi:hypothetical protein
MENIGFIILVVVIIIIMYFYLDNKFKRRMEMVKLWIDHVTYTRLYILAAVNSNPDASNLLARLMQNQDSIGIMYEKMYGEEQSRMLSNLLKEHIAIAGKIIDTAINSRIIE